MKRVRFLTAVFSLLAGMLFFVSNTTQAKLPLPVATHNIVWTGSDSGSVSTFETSTSNVAIEEACEEICGGVTECDFPIIKGNRYCEYTTKVGTCYVGVNIGTGAVYSKTNIFGWRGTWAVEPKCTDNLDCIDDEYCNGEESCKSGHCLEGISPCNEEQVCVEAGEVCVECLDDADCPDGVCLADNTCVECEDNADCSGVSLCLADNTCADCVEDSDCLEGNCLENICVLECEDDIDCPDGVCLANDTCGECEDDADCPDDGVCLADNTCAECADDADCPDGVCLADNTCAECEDDADCPNGECVENICVFDCVDDADCPDGVCLADNTCAECENDPDCPDGVCLVDNTCAECADDADCPDGECIRNTCVPDTVEGTLTIDKCKVKAGKKDQSDSIQFSGMLDGATEGDFNASDVVVTIEAADIPGTGIITYTLPIDEGSLKKGKYKSPKDKINPATSLKLDINKGKMKFSSKKDDLIGLGCPITVTIQIGAFFATEVLDEAIVNGSKPCPPELLEGI